MPGPTPTSARASTSTNSTTAATDDPAYNRVMAISQQFAAAYTQILRANALEQGGEVAEARAVRASATAEMQRLNKTLLPQYQKALAQLTGGSG